MKIFNRAESPSLIERYMANVERTKKEIADLENAIPIKRRRIEQLALSAEGGDAAALAEIDKLYDEIERDKRALDRKSIVLKAEQKNLSDERTAKQASDDRLARENMLKLLRKREAFAKDAERGARIFIESVAAIYDTDKQARGAWRSSWPGGFEALVGADQSYTRATPGERVAHSVTGMGPYTPTPGLAEFVRQMLGHLCSEFQVRVPEPAYSATRDPYFPGLMASYAAITARIKRLFAEAEQEPSEGEATEPSPKAEQVQPQVAPTRMTDNEILANEAAGNPLELPLSGREWNKIEKFGKQPKSPVADGTDFDVFNPNNI